MKLLNPGETTVFLDDINVYIPFSKSKTPFEVADDVASRSRKLRTALDKGILIDASGGVPPSYKPRIQTVGVKQAADGPMAKDLFLEDGSLCCHWVGSAGEATGYGRLNRRFMFGLADKGVAVKYCPVNGLNDMGKNGAADLLLLQLNSVPRGAPAFYSMPAAVVNDDIQHRVFLTMMETNRLHEDYVYRCNAAQEVIVPSNWCKRVFEESGVKAPVHVVPLGVDPCFSPEAAPLALSGSRSFVFLSVFQWSLRKGYDVLIRAFSEEFSGSDDVCLVISSRMFGPPSEEKKRIVRAEIKRIVAETGNPNPPRILYYGDVLAEELMPRLYASADCFVLPSRGEGFGLPYLEAGATRLPVIGTRYSGQEDFLSDENSFLVDVDSFGPPAPELEATSRFFQGIDFPVLGRAAVDQTRAHMRFVYEDKEEAQKRARNLHQKVLSDYCWSKCVETMYLKLIETFRRL
jgi:glycosyltransferase involved in cell wall biosynthesis